MTTRFFPGAEGFAAPRSWALLACALSLLAGTGAATATEAAGVSDDYSVTLQQLGRNYPMNLRGVEATDSVNFNVRADQVVTGASLTLSYSYSPSLLEDLSQINVMINNEVAATLPLPKDNAGKPQTQVIEIPPQMITEFNRLSLQFIGHYTMSCEDPRHSSLWARINNDTRLDIRVTPFALPNDLAILPLPFSTAAMIVT